MLTFKEFMQESYHIEFKGGSHNSDWEPHTGFGQDKTTKKFSSLDKAHSVAKEIHKGTNTPGSGYRVVNSKTKEVHRQHVN